MAEMSEKGDLILKNEEQFAATLAVRVLDKPDFSIWIILIPILFAFYLLEIQKFSKGKKAFAGNYLISVRCALNEAVIVVQTGKDPDVEKLLKASNVPDDAKKLQAEMLTILVEHFIALLRSDGDDFDSMVRSAYLSRTKYLSFFNNLNKAEKKYNSALNPHLQKTHEDVDRIMNKIEVESEMLRKKNAERIFP